MKRSRYTIATIIILIVIFVGIKAFEWWNTTYWDEIRYFAPSWTPDNKICFIKEIKNNSKLEHIFFPLSLLTFGLETVNSFGEPEYYLCTMNIDGSDKEEIAKMPRGYKPELISWARNNSVVVLSGKFYEKGIEKEAMIASVNPEDTQVNFLIDGVMADVSPDGSKIAYPNKGIWIANIDGSNQRKMQDNGINPLWSPNGKMIAFERYVERKGKEIWVMNKEGKEQRKIAEYPYFSNSIAIIFGWFNEGKYLWTYKGKIDLNGNIIDSYDVDQGNERVIGIISSDNTKFVNAAYFPKRSVDNGRVLFVGDLAGNKIYEEVNYAIIKYGKQNRKQTNNIWIKK